MVKDVKYFWDATVAVQYTRILDSLPATLQILVKTLVDTRSRIHIITRISHTTPLSTVIQKAKWETLSISVWV